MSIRLGDKAMASWSGSFEDTVSPRYAAIFAGFDHIKLWLETLDWTAADASEQAVRHAWLDRLEAWIKESDTWDASEMERTRLESLQSFADNLRSGEPEDQNQGENPMTEGQRIIDILTPIHLTTPGRQRHRQRGLLSPGQLHHQ
jgi:hypothetical protein